MEEYLRLTNSSEPHWLPGGKVPPLPSWLPPPRLEDDSWLDEEIQKEDDKRMKDVMIEVKRTMRTISNQRKREYISDERNRIIEWKHYHNDMKTTQGFEVGDYPYLARKVLGSFITRYYYPPDIKITDFELDQLTRLADMAIDLHNNIIDKRVRYGNVLVIKAMRCFSRGFNYYLTFQASPRHPHPPEIFEAKVYVEKQDLPKFEFVRRARSYLQSN